VANKRTVLGDFGGAKFIYAGVTSTFFRRDARFYVNTAGSEGRLADFEVKYAGGCRPPASPGTRALAPRVGSGGSTSIRMNGSTSGTCCTGPVRPLLNLA